MTNSQDLKVQAAIAAHGENFHFEFRKRGTSIWYRSPHLARPLDEAEALVKRLNGEDTQIEYRYMPWDGD
ncbi:hypothetical protein AB4Y45_32655 [Paraburkholderia sp. EG287A]|uniref:hypothetical protein n=1 Tax=Paraburkholderia sp. EG287A TaxID=3237012 RepID=UPI0034D2096A